MQRRRQLGAASALLFAALLAGGCSQPTYTQPPVDRDKVKLIRAEISEGTGGPAVAASRPDPTGFATLTGSFKFPAGDAGQFTTRPLLAVEGGDAAYCKSHGDPKSSTLLVKPTGEIQNVVIYLGDDLSKVEKPELWIHPSQAPGSNKETVVFDQKDCVFLSPVVGMQVSQPLHILNSDSVGHNTKLENSNQISEIIPPGGDLNYQHRKEERAPYPVTCNIHPWMRAFILVRDNGYYAVTDENGNFKIENLPAGVDLNIKVWHEKLDGAVQNVTVNGEKTTWSKKGFTLKLAPDQETNLEVVVDAAPFAE